MYDEFAMIANVRLLLLLLPMGITGAYSVGLYVLITALPRAIIIAATTSTGASPSPTPPQIPGVRDVMEGASWLSQQQISVWFAIITILFGAVIFFIIKYLLKAMDSMRAEHALQMKDQRDGFDKLQTEEKALSLQLLQYLEKDHSQTVVLLKENQIIMQENIQLLKAIQQDRHDDHLLRQKNHDILNRIDKSQIKQASDAEAAR